MSEKLIKINDSEKTRKSSTKGGILPNTFSHTDDLTAAAPKEASEGWGPCMKKHKYKILGIVFILVLALVLGITIHDEDKPTPPPGP